MTNFLKNNLVYYATYKCRFECVVFFFFFFFVVFFAFYWQHVA